MSAQALVGREVRKLREPFRRTVRPPGSKSLAARALIAASMAEGESVIRGDLGANDIRVLADGLRSLGVQLDWKTNPAGSGAPPDIITIKGPSRGSRLVREAGEAGGECGSGDCAIDAKDSGTAARFLIARAALSGRPAVIDGNARLRERPMRPLVEALGVLGSSVRSTGRAGLLPVRVDGGGISGGACSIEGSSSSQFLSALLLALGGADGPSRIEVMGPLVSEPYVDMTLRVLTHFGFRAARLPRPRAAVPVFEVDPAAGAGAGFDVEPDASSAGYAFAAAAITGGCAIIPGLCQGSGQPDLRLIDLLAGMGCTVRDDGTAGTRGSSGGTHSTGTLELHGPQDRHSLRAIDADLSATPDSVPALAAVALFADGPSTFRGIAHLRLKESDRVEALAAELSKFGARVESFADRIIIHPLPGTRSQGAGSSNRPISIDAHGDHRIAMAMAVCGLRLGGVRILDPGCVAKSFPGFWTEVIL